MIKKFYDVLEIKNGLNQQQVEDKNGIYPIYGSGGIIGYANNYLCEANTIVLGRKGSINNPIFVEEKFWNIDTAFGLIPKTDFLVPKYLYYFCKNFNFENLNTTVTIPSLTKANLLKIDISLPPLDIQQDIVEILDAFGKIIKLRKKQVKALNSLVKSRFVEMFGDPVTNPMEWNERPLLKYLQVIGGYAFSSDSFSKEGIPVLRIGNINAGVFRNTNLVFWNIDEKLSRYLVHPGDIVISLTGTVGKDDYANVCILGYEYESYYLNQRNAKLELQDTLDKYYLINILRIPEIKAKLTRINRGVRQANVSNNDILNLILPIPPISLQKEFASFVQQVDKSKFVMQKGLDMV